MANSTIRTNKEEEDSRVSPYVESEFWERDELLTVVKYESHRRNKADLTLLWDLNARNHEVTFLNQAHQARGSVRRSRDSSRVKDWTAQPCLRVHSHM